MLRAGHVVFLCALALLCFGVIMVSSAGMSIDPVQVAPLGAEALPPSHAQEAATSRTGRAQSDSLGGFLKTVLLSRSTAYMVLAVAAMCLTAALPLGWLARFEGPASSLHRRAGRDRLPLSLPVLFLIGGTVILVVLISMAYWPGIGRSVNGSARWVHIPLPGTGRFSYQPSEIAKWGLIVILAVYCAIGAGTAGMSSFFKGLLPALAALGILGAAVAFEDLGTGVLMVAAGSIMLIAAGARLWHFLMFVPPALAAFVLLCVSSDYRLRRIETFFDPYLDPQGSGYHMIQSMAAVAGGGGFGRGLGHGLQKFGYLPEDTTDFLFAIICEELGIAGAALVIGLYIILIWAGLGVIRGQQSTLLKLLGLGIISTVGLQALINLAVVTGLGPTKGIALPLVSAGGTGWILTAASLGLLVAIDRASNETEEVEAPPAGRAALADRQTEIKPRSRGLRSRHPSTSAHPTQLA